MPCPLTRLVHNIDVLGVLATILGVSVTIGFDVSQLVDGMYAIRGMEWSMNGAETPAPSKVGLITAFCIIMALSIPSADSGVGRGVKYLSNLNLVLSLVLLLVFVVFGSFLFGMTTYATAIFDHILHFLLLSIDAYGPQTLEGFLTTALSAIGSLPAADQAAVHYHGPDGHIADQSIVSR